VALAPLLAALEFPASRPSGARRPWIRPALLGFLTGLVFFTGALYWIAGVMSVYGGLPDSLAVLLNAGLVLYLSCFTAAFAWATDRLMRVHGRIAVLAAPFLWITFEIARGYMTGFSWAALGHSQVTVLPIAQFASLGGVNSLALLVVAASASLVFAFDRSPYRYWPIAAVIVVSVGIAVWGSRRLAANDLTREGEPVRIGLVQGNVDQAIKWDPASASRIFDDYIRDTRGAIGAGAQIVMWPESSTPFMFEEDPIGAERLRTLAREAHVALVFGSDQIEHTTPMKYFNSAFLVRPDGTTGGVYRKMQLVPFGEYVPMQRLLFFAAPLTEQVGTFTAGERPDLLSVDGHRLSVAICYEVVYPALVRRFVTAGSELLTTITNDAWFGPTSAPYQHFEQAAMRAIENGRYLVRAANTGISGLVDPYGRVLEQTPIFQPAVRVVDARFLSSTTFFTRHGDLAGTGSIILTVILLVWSWRSRPSRTM